MLASHHRLARTRVWDDDEGQTVNEEWARAHAQFHSDLLSASPSPRLRDLADGLRETAELFRRWSGSFTADQGRRDVAAEHEALMQAAIARDADLAVELLADHINKTTELLAQYVEANQDKVTPRVGRRNGRARA